MTIQEQLDALIAVYEFGERRPDRIMVDCPAASLRFCTVDPSGGRSYRGYRIEQPPAREQKPERTRTTRKQQSHLDRLRTEQ